MKAKQLWEFLEVNVFEVLSAVLLIGSALLIGFEVFNRNLLGFSTSWIEELVRYSIIWAYFLILGSSVAYRVHVRVVFLVEHLSPRNRAALEIVTDLIGLGFFLLLLIFSAKTVHQQQVMNLRSWSGLAMPRWIIYLCIPLGSALFSIRTLMRIAENARHLIRREEPQNNLDQGL